MRAIRYILLGVIVITLAGYVCMAFGLGPLMAYESICIAARDGKLDLLIDPKEPSYACEYFPGINLFDGVAVNEWFPLPEFTHPFYVLPYWCFLVACVPPWFILHRRHREQRRRAMVGACASCAYDLTGNESGVCSECGEAVQSPTDAKGTT